MVVYHLLLFGCVHGLCGRKEVTDGLAGFDKRKCPDAMGWVLFGEEFLHERLELGWARGWGGSALEGDSKNDFG